MRGSGENYGRGADAGAAEAGQVAAAGLVDYEDDERLGRSDVGLTLRVAVATGTSIGQGMERWAPFPLAAVVWGADVAADDTCDAQRVAVCEAVAAEAVRGRCLGQLVGLYKLTGNVYCGRAAT